MSKQCYMPFFYDWCAVFSLLDGEDCKQLLLAMANYHQNGAEIPEFSKTAAIAAAMIFPQIDRFKAVSDTRAKQGAKGGSANRSKSKLQNKYKNKNKYYYKHKHKYECGRIPVRGRCLRRPLRCVCKKPSRAIDFTCESIRSSRGGGTKKRDG